MAEVQKDLGREGRRVFKGLIVSKQYQFKIAVMCSSLLLLPSLVSSVTLIADLALEARRMVDAGSPAEEIATQLSGLAFTHALWVVAAFVICAAISIFVSLRFSNEMIGPVARLEDQVDQMLNGHFKKIPPLRKDDYLKGLGEKLNALAAKSATPSDRG
jgi:hypothetical protein